MCFTVSHFRNKRFALNEMLLGGVHKLREQGRGRGVVLKMFTLVHKGEEGGSANVHVGLNCKYFK